MHKFTRAAVKQLVFEAFDEYAAAPTVEPVESISANPVVDPTGGTSQVGGNDYVPQNRAEFTVAVGRLTDGLDDEDFPALYQQVKTALAAIEDDEDSRENKDEDGMGPLKTKEQKVAEQLVRRAIRKLLGEATPRGDLSYSGPDTFALASSTDEPWKVYEIDKKTGKQKKRPSGSFDDEDSAKDYQRSLGRRGVESVIVDESEEQAPQPKAPKGEWAVDRVEGGEKMGDIAKALGVSQMGAQVIAVRALKRFGHMFKMMYGDLEGEGSQPEEAELMILQAAKDFMTELGDDVKQQRIVDRLFTGADVQRLLPDSVEKYREFLATSGELTAADVQLLSDHPQMVAELDSYKDFVVSELDQELKAELADLPNDVDKILSLDAFREYLSKYVKRSMRQSGDVDESVRRSSKNKSR